jgi:hypothetical protein
MEKNVIKQVVIMALVTVKKLKRVIWLTAKTVNADLILAEMRNLILVKNATPLHQTIQTHIARKQRKDLTLCVRTASVLMPAVMEKLLLEKNVMMGILLTAMAAMRCAKKNVEMA